MVVSPRLWLVLKDEVDDHGGEEKVVDGQRADVPACCPQCAAGQRGQVHEVLVVQEADGGFEADSPGISMLGLGDGLDEVSTVQHATALVVQGYQTELLVDQNRGDGLAIIILWWHDSLHERGHLAPYFVESHVELLDLGVGGSGEGVGLAGDETEDLTDGGFPDRVCQHGVLGVGPGGG